MRCCKESRQNVKKHSRDRDRAPVEQYSHATLDLQRIVGLGCLFSCFPNEATVVTVAKKMMRQFAVRHQEARECESWLCLARVSCLPEQAAPLASCCSRFCRLAELATGQVRAVFAGAGFSCVFFLA